MEDAGIVHPTNIPQPPKLTWEDRDLIIDLVRSEGWQIIQKIWSWQYQSTMVHLMNAQQGHQHYQGQIKGMAGLMDGINQLSEWATKAPIKKKKHKVPLTENQFFNNWAKQNASTKSKETGY
jgi:hypothetical protein